MHTLGTRNVQFLYFYVINHYNIMKHPFHYLLLLLPAPPQSLCSCGNADQLPETVPDDFAGSKEKVNH